MHTAEAILRPESTAVQPAIFDRPQLIRQLRGLGLTSGDIVLSRVGFKPMGPIRMPGDVTLIESLLEVIGRRGVVLSLTHSPTQFYFQRNRNYVYDPVTAPVLTGLFANGVLRWPGAYRSLHPTCSFTGVGSAAQDLLQGHDHRSTCFAPVRNLIHAGAKELIIGCTRSGPGCATVHYVYEELGLATKSLLSGWLGCYYRNGSRVQWFAQRDVPGCSLGFHKLYPLYKQHGAMTVGRVGLAEAFVIDYAKAIRVEREAVRADPKISLCDAPDCFYCRGTKLFNLTDMARYWSLRVPAKLLRTLRRLVA
jgi:aminoglycoside N3'-acetyltransferase